MEDAYRKCIALELYYYSIYFAVYIVSYFPEFEMVYKKLVVSLQRISV